MHVSLRPSALLWSRVVRPSVDVSYFRLFLETSEQNLTKIDRNQVLSPFCQRFVFGPIEKKKDGRPTI